MNESQPLSSWAPVVLTEWDTFMQPYPNRSLALPLP